MNEKTKGILFVLLSAMMFGSYGIWSKFIGVDFGNFYQAWTRAVIIVVGLFPILFYTKQIITIKKKDLGWFLIFLIFTAGTQAPLFYAFNHMDIGTATLLFFVSMLITMYIVGSLFLKERVTYIKVISFILSIVGLSVTFQFTVLSFSLLPAAMAVLNGVAAGGEVAFSKKLTGNYSVIYVLWLSWVVILITNFAISVSLGEIQHIPSLDIVWLWQIMYAIVGLLGFYFVMTGVKYVEASIAGLLASLEVIFAIIFGVFIFNESVSLQIVVGGVLILIATVLPHLFIEKRIDVV